MCTFKGKFNEDALKGIMIDNFIDYNESKAFFLTHFHSDHIKGLDDLCFQKYFNDCNNIYLYCSEITKKLITKSSTIKLNVERIIVHEEAEIYICPNDESIKVSALRAGHCPGSLMYLFEASDIKILFTGDFRLSMNDLKLCKPLHSIDGCVIKLDCIYLDTTFSTDDYETFPTRETSLKLIINLMKRLSKSVEHPYFIIKQPALIGQEYLMYNLSEVFDKPIHISDDICFYYTSCIDQLANVITSDMRKTNIHFCFQNCKCCLNLKQRFVIKPTAYIFDKNFLLKGPVQKVSDSIWRVAYSSHSSLQELSDFVSYLKPKTIEPIVVRKDQSKYEITDNIYTYCPPVQQREMFQKPFRKKIKVVHLERIDKSEYVKLGLESP